MRKTVSSPSLKDSDSIFKSIIDGTFYTDFPRVHYILISNTVQEFKNHYFERNTYFKSLQKEYVVSSFSEGEETVFLIQTYSDYRLWTK